MARYLLDTNVVSEPVVKNPDRRVLGRIEKHAHECAIASPVIHELIYGIRLLGPSRRRDDIQRYLDEVVLRVFPVLPYDQVAAESHAEERARLERKGRSIPFVDGMIAAIAKSNGLILVTRNVRDFERYEGLAIENWRR